MLTPNLTYVATLLVAGLLLLAQALVLIVLFIVAVAVLALGRIASAPLWRRRSRRRERVRDGDRTSRRPVPGRPPEAGMEPPTSGPRAKQSATGTAS